MDQSQYLENLVIIGQENQLFSKKCYFDFEVTFDYIAFSVNDNKNLMAFVTQTQIKIFQITETVLSIIDNLDIENMTSIKFLKYSNSFILFNQNYIGKIIYYIFNDQDQKWQIKQKVKDEIQVLDLQINQNNSYMGILERNQISIFQFQNEKWMLISVYRHFLPLLKFTICKQNNNIVFQDVTNMLQILLLQQNQIRKCIILFQIEPKSQFQYLKHLLLVHTSSHTYVKCIHQKKILRKIHIDFSIIEEKKKMNAGLLLRNKFEAFPMFLFLKCSTSDDGLLNAIQSYQRIDEKEKLNFLSIRNKNKYIIFIEFKKC